MGMLSIGGEGVMTIRRDCISYSCRHVTSLTHSAAASFPSEGVNLTS